MQRNISRAFQIHPQGSDTPAFDTHSCGWWWAERAAWSTLHRTPWKFISDQISKHRVGLLGLVFNLKWCDLKKKVMLVLKAADFGGKFDVLSDKSSSRILGRFMTLFPKRILPGVGAVDYRPHCVLISAKTLMCSALLQTANA